MNDDIDLWPPGAPLRLSVGIQGEDVLKDWIRLLDNIEEGLFSLRMITYLQCVSDLPVREDVATLTAGVDAVNDATVPSSNAESLDAFWIRRSLRSRRRCSTKTGNG